GDGDIHHQGALGGGEVVEEAEFADLLAIAEDGLDEDQPAADIVGVGGARQGRQLRQAFAAVGGEWLGSAGLEDGGGGELVNLGEAAEGGGGIFGVVEIECGGAVGGDDASLGGNVV